MVSLSQATMLIEVCVCFSASNAIQGDGLQEGVDWLQGTDVSFYLGKTLLSVNQR